MASAILALAVVALTQAVAAAQMQTVDALHRTRATELADALMEEVLRLPYADPDGSGGELTRATFDDMQDFNGFTEAAGTISDSGGTAYDSPLQGFSRSVTVVPANGGGGISVTGFGNPLVGLTITVTVQDTAGATWTLTRFKAQPPA